MIEKEDQTVLTSEPVLADEAPKNWLNDFAKEANPNPATFGYVPLKTNAPEEPKGSVYLAHLRQENTIGSMLNRETTYNLSENVRDDYDFTNYIKMIPRDLIDYADRFYGASNENDFKSIEQQLRKELADKSLLAANPWKSLAYAFDPLEPTNWLPGGIIFKDVKAASAIARSMMGGSIAMAASTGLSEAALHENQLTRTNQESLFNIVGAGLLGGVIGGGLAAYGSKKLAKGVDAFDSEAYKTREFIQNDINQAINPSGDLSSGKSALLEGNELARLPSFIQKSMKLTPMNRLLTSPFKSAQWLGSAIFEHNYLLKKNEAGIATDMALESQVKNTMRELQSKQIDHMNLFYKMHGVSGYFKNTKTKLNELGVESPINININQFNKAVYEVALTGEQHAIPEINAAANMWRNEFDKLKEEAVSLNLLGEGVEVPNAPHYIMIMYNKNKIIEEGGRSARTEGTFAHHLFTRFLESNESVKQYLESPQFIKLQDQIKLLKKEHRIEVKKENKQTIKEEIAKLEQEIIDKAPSKAKTWDGKLLRVIKENAAQDVDQLIWQEVEQTIDHILGDSEGRLLNPFIAKLGGSTKPFKPRKLMIDQLEASPWHITDIQKIAEAHSRAMIPAITMQKFAKQHGFNDYSDMLLGLEDLLKKERDTALEAVTGKKAQNIRTKYEENLRDIKAGFEMVQGVYGQGFNVLNGSAQQFYNNVLNWNYSRMLGHMTLASLPDMANIVMRNGITETLATGIGSTFSIAKKMSKNDLKAMGYAIETELGSQFKNYVEHSGLSTNPSPFTKSLNALTQSFGNLSLMNPWMDMVENMSGHMAINKLLNIIHKSVDGKKVTQKEIRNIARLGIPQEHFETIARFTKDKIIDGTRIADWTNWEIKTISESNALKSFQAAVAKSINEINIIPNFGDKPLFLQQKGLFGTMSKLMFQFKSYMFAATNRIFYSGLQNLDDINTYLGIVSMMGLGMLGYVSSSILRGSEPDLSTKNLLREGLDRSSVLGLFGELANMAQKNLQLGEVSRYKSRDAFGSILGPTGGSASQIISLFNKVDPLSNAKGEWTTKDAEAVMRLMPLQNLFYINKITRAITHTIAEGLGATPVND
jgi:hypothetical protein